jgi:hypothetical protein
VNGGEFDRITKRAGAGGTRRWLLRSLAGGAMAAAVAGIETADAASRPRSDGNACRYDSDCISGQCVQRSRTRAICGTGCSNAVLSSDANGGAVCVDDEMAVYVNGVLVFQHLGGSGCLGSPGLGTVINGDAIHVVANNSSLFCGFESISPLYLSCPGTSLIQTLDAVGVPDDGQYHDCGNIFYDRVFTAAF